MQCLTFFLFFSCFFFLSGRAFACLQMQKNTWMTSSSGTVWFHVPWLFMARWNAVFHLCSTEECFARKIIQILQNTVITHYWWHFGYGKTFPNSKSRTHEWHHQQNLTGSMFHDSSRRDETRYSACAALRSAARKTALCEKNNTNSSKYSHHLLLVTFWVRQNIAKFKIIY